MSNLKVAVLVPPDDPSGSADRADTFLQAAEISECLSILGNECLTVVFTDDRAATAGALREAAPDVVFNLVEDVPEGPDCLYLATEVLDLLGLPHTGASTAALRALGDKRRVKAMLTAAGLPTPASLETSPPAATDAPRRYIVKSAIEHASIGLDAASVVTGSEAAAAAIAARAAQYGGPWFAEAYVDGREFNVALLDAPPGPRPLPVAEILFLAHADRPRIVGYDEKWATASSAYAETPRAFPTEAADQELLAELRELGRKTWQLFGLGGYARIDFRVDARGAPFIVDVNANPCLARDAGFCAAARRAGLSQADIVAQLLETALA